MNATASINSDRQHYQKKYEEWFKHRSRWRKYSLPAAIFFVLLGVLIWFFSPEKIRLLGLVVILSGVYELITSLTAKGRWIKKCLKHMSDKTMEIKFEEESIHTVSEDGTATIKISSLPEVVPATDGFFLVLNRTTSLYVHRQNAVPPEAYESLVGHLVMMAKSK